MCGSARLCLLGLGLLSACTTITVDALVDDPSGLPLEAEVATVPFFPQEDNFCGPAALAMVLAWSGVPMTPALAARQVYTPGREGTLRTDIVAAARRNGRLAVAVEMLPDLLAEIAAGHPIIVFQNLGLSWVPQWHFAVAVGYDLERREIVLHSGRDAMRRVALDTFERTWARGDRWALVVLPPRRLPATGNEIALLQAAAGLERAGQSAAAALAYRAILDRWPDSFGAWMGLGNARFAAGDPTAAEAAFREAIAHHPKAPEAWNNLAYALSAQDRHREALSAIRHAVDLAGEAAAPYLESRAELRRRSAAASTPAS